MPAIVRTHVAQEFGGDYRLEQRTALHGDANGVEDLFARRAFEQVTIRSGFQRRYDAFVVIKGGEHDNTGLPVSRRARMWVLPQVTNGFDSIHDGHFQVE